MTEHESRAKQSRFLRYSERFRAVCERASSDVLRAHFRRLHERREAMVMRGMREGAWCDHYSLYGVVMDIGTVSVFTISHVLGERRRIADWSAARGLRSYVESV